MKTALSDDSEDNSSAIFIGPCLSFRTFQKPIIFPDIGWDMQFCIVSGKTVWYFGRLFDRILAIQKGKFGGIHEKKHT